MQSEQPSKSKSSLIRFWDLFQKLAIIIALLASLATVISVWLQIRQPATKIDVLIESEHLTAIPQIPDLRAEFSFRDKLVSDLWRLSVRITNTGDKTIIGEGQLKNLLGNQVSLFVPNGYEILGIQVDSASFPVEVTQLTERSFSMRFAQWRRRESLRLTIYLQRLPQADDKPSLYSEDRPILDGDVLIRDVTNQIDTTKTPLLDRLNPVLANTLRIVSVIVLLLLTAFCFYLLIKELWGIWKFLDWQSKYYDDFMKFVRSKYGEYSEEKLKSWKSDFVLWDLDDALWKEFSGPRAPIPNYNPTDKKDIIELLRFTLILSVLIVVMLVSITGLIII